MEINVQRETCHWEENGDSGAKQHAHVDEGENLAVSPVPVESEASMDAHVAVDGFTFGFVFPSFKRAASAVDHGPNFDHDLNENFK